MECQSQKELSTQSSAFAGSFGGKSCCQGLQAWNLGRHPQTLSWLSSAPKGPYGQVQLVDKVL